MQTSHRQRTATFAQHIDQYGYLFEGTLGTWNTDPIDIELKEPDCKPYHAKPHPVPYSQEQKL
jgi:hypothetical protein